MELKWVPDMARRPWPEETPIPDTILAQILSKHASFFVGLTRLKRMYDVLGSSKAHIIPRTREARAEIPIIPTLTWPTKIYLCKHKAQLVESTSVSRNIA